MEKEVEEQRLILGLGNPGERYQATRHNLGFRVVEELARRWNLKLDREVCNSRFGGGPRGDLAAPQTFMNRSGLAARCLVERFGYPPEGVLVVFDEVQLPLGRLRMRPRGGPGGHRGMESIVENLRSLEIPRLRLGIAPSVDEAALDEELAEYVLAPFEPDELPTVAEVVSRAASACESWLEKGTQETMNQFNG